MAIVLGSGCLLRLLTHEAILGSPGHALSGSLEQFIIPEAGELKGICFRTGYNSFYVHPRITTWEMYRAYGESSTLLEITLQDDIVVVHREKGGHRIATSPSIDSQLASVDDLIMLVQYVVHPGVCAREVQCRSPLFTALNVRSAVLLRDEHGAHLDPVLWCAACYDVLRQQVADRLIIDGRRIRYRLPIELAAD